MQEDQEMAYGDLGLPSTVTPEDRTMVFKELKLLGWEIEWNSKRNGYNLARSLLRISYTYNFAKGVYELGRAWILSRTLKEPVFLDLGS